MLAKGPFGVRQSVGIVQHIQFMVGLRQERHEMAVEGLIHSQSKFPASFTLLMAIVNLSFNIRLFE